VPRGVTFPQDLEDAESDPEPPAEILEPHRVPPFPPPAPHRPQGLTVPWSLASSRRRVFNPQRRPIPGWDIDRHVGRATTTPGTILRLSTDHAEGQWIG